MVPKPSRIFALIIGPGCASAAAAAPFAPPTISLENAQPSRSRRSRPPRAPPPPSDRRPPPTVPSALADEVAPGRLVEFSPSSTLGAVLSPDGKRNWRVITSSGRTPSVPLRDIRHVVPNGTADTATRVREHEAAAEEALAIDAAAGGADVSAVWEMLLEDASASGDGASSPAPPAAVELTTLADLIAGDDTSVSCYAARAVLTGGVRSYCFREVRAKGGGGGIAYEPRPADVVEALRERARAEAEEEAGWSELRERVDAACGASPSPSAAAAAAAAADSTFDLGSETDEVRSAFASLERLGCLANLSPQEAEREEKAAAGAGGGADTALSSARSFLKRLGRRPTPEAARSVLVGTGLWDAHANLDLIRLRVPTEFPRPLEDEAAELAARPPPDPDASSRLDLTHLPALAIDDASTMEIDDALSVEAIAISDAESDPGEGGGATPPRARQRLWVHIADPTRYVELGSPLDREARRRSSSLYLPTGAVPMFPMSLASGPLCLSPGGVSCALSVGVALDADGGIDGSTPAVIAPSLVRVTRLTYEQVDAMLDPFALVGDDGAGSHDVGGGDALNARETIECLRRLQWASRQRLEWRKGGGSLESIGPYELPDMSIKAWQSPDEPDGWGVSVAATERHEASRIVTELMLLANEAIATYGAANGVPMPFRSQEMRDVADREIDAAPGGPCRSWLAIQSAAPPRISSAAGPHGGLGLDAYVQATSPVRRYADLALHHQLKAHLRGDALPFPAADAGAGAGADGDGDGDGDGASGGPSRDIVRLARDGGRAYRLLERSARDYWLREFLRRRGGGPTAALVLSTDRRRQDFYKLFLPELGAIITYKSTRPLKIGKELEMPSSALCDFI